ncbi:MAG TPA: hypothetical protein VF020_03765, partial [Chthoniobacterales bacterium]
EHCFNFLFIAKPGMIRANRDLHRPNSVVGVKGVQAKESGARIQEPGGLRWGERSTGGEPL